MNQEREYKITPSPDYLSTAQEMDLFQNVVYRLIHNVKQKVANPDSILEICFGDSFYSELLRDVYPNSDFFLLNLEKNVPRSLTPLYGSISSDRFDIILISPNGYLHQCKDEIMRFCHTRLKEEGLFAGILFGYDMFMELRTSWNWLASQQVLETEVFTSFPTNSAWQERFKQSGLVISSIKEEWFRKYHKSSQELFQIATKLNFLQTVEKKDSLTINDTIEEWMTSYDRGFRTKEGRIYATYHLIELIGHFL